MLIFGGVGLDSAIQSERLDERKHLPKRDRTQKTTTNQIGMLPGRSRLYCKQYAFDLVHAAFSYSHMVSVVSVYQFDSGVGRTFDELFSLSDHEQLKQKENKPNEIFVSSQRRATAGQTTNNKR